MGAIEGYKASDHVISIEVTENVDVSVAIHSCRPAARQNADAVIASSSAQLVFGSLKVSICRTDRAQNGQVHCGWPPSIEVTIDRGH